MTVLKFANNAISQTLASIAPNVTSVSVVLAQADLFPTIGAGEQFYATLYDAAKVANEIVLVTNRTANVMTIARAQDGTTAKTWPAGSLFELLLPRAVLESFLQTGQSQVQAQNYGEDTGTAGAYVVAYTPALSVPPGDGTPLRFLVGHTNPGASTFNGGYGALPITRRDGSALIGGELVANSVVTLFPQGDSSFLLPGIAPATDAAIATGTDEQSGVTPKQLLDSVGSNVFVVVPITTGVVTIDLDAHPGAVFLLTVNANFEIEIVGTPSSPNVASFILQTIGNGSVFTGDMTFAEFPNGAAPIQSSGSGKRDTYGFIWTGAWFGFIMGQNAG